ncbi:MAG: hypothetical protein NTX50_28865 [Candidatus Sumerlaeota bacterium]|nr:hypothetical protein [Candidatus Sumerlaeota bacterium]
MRLMPLVTLCLLAFWAAYGNDNPTTTLASSQLALSQLASSQLAAEKPIAPVSNDDVKSFALKAMESLRAERAGTLKTCKGGDLSGIYFSSYSLDGALAGAEATGDEEFLKIAIECIDAIIASGKN